jgi:hypothetical protein
MQAEIETIAIGKIISFFTLWTGPDVLIVWYACTGGPKSKSSSSSGSLEMLSDMRYPYSF